jgi:purine nucleosidase
VSTPLLMDVDTGVDDALALMLALSRPDVELVAVTCCAGNVDAQQAAANTLAVLELCAAPGVEVAVGSEAPLVEQLRTATSHGPRGLGYAEPPPARASVSTRYAPDLIVEESWRRPGELTLVATGPLTNVALALRREPALPQLLRRLAVMGGSFGHPGNTTPSAEFNIWVDPEAAQEVFEAFSLAPVRPLVAGLNVTEQTELRPEHLAALGTGAIAEFVAAAVGIKFEHNGGVAHMHDPLALALALDVALGTTRPGTVDVELMGSLTRAMTVVDWHGLWGRKHNADVAVAVDVERFLAVLVNGLAALGRSVEGTRANAAQR